MVRIEDSEREENTMKAIKFQRVISRDEIKERELSILLLFQEFCQNQGLRFYLAGGTLLKL